MRHFPPRVGSVRRLGCNERFQGCRASFPVCGALCRRVLVFLVVRELTWFPRALGSMDTIAGRRSARLQRKPVKFAGHETCETCHTDIATPRAKGKHAHVNCEACHGALAKHADDPASVTPVKPDTAVLCARCHTASAAKPKDFPQVDPADHSGGVPCETCHQPAQPGD